MVSTYFIRWPHVMSTLSVFFTFDLPWYKPILFSCISVPLSIIWMLCTLWKPYCFPISWLVIVFSDSSFVSSLLWVSPLFYKIDNYLWYKMWVFSIFYTRLLTYDIRRERPFFLVTVQHHHASTQSFTDGNTVVPGGGVRVYREAPPPNPSKAWLTGVTQTIDYK